MVIFVILGVLSRLLPHPANFTAIGGLALFSGARMRLEKALFITVTTMLITDFIIGFHVVMWATYGGILVAVFVGHTTRNRRSIRWIASSVLFSSVFFFLLTNFAVWIIPGSLYPKTLDGLLLSYVMAVPFFRNSLLGDFFYTSVFFGGYEWIHSLSLRKHLLLQSGGVQ